MGSNNLMKLFSPSCFVLSLTMLCSSATAQLIIEGVDAELESLLRQQLAQMDAPCAMSEARARGMARSLATDSREILRAVGFYQPEIAQQLHLDEAGCRQIRLSVNPGNPTLIEVVDIRLLGDGAQDPDFDAILAAQPIVEGVRLRHGDYEQLKADLERVALRKGYYDARFSLGRIEVDPSRARANIRLHYDTGSRYRYGEISIEDMGKPSTEFLRRYLPFDEGDPVNSSQLVELQRRLIDSQYFASVSVRPLIEERAAGRVDVRISLRTIKPWYFTVGLGMDTDAGPRASLGVQNRLLNRQGDRASADFSYAPKLRTLEFRHRHPLEDPTREVRQWQAGIRDESADLASSRRYSLGWGRITSQDSGWIRTLGTSFSREDSRIGEQEFHTQLLMPSIAWQQTRRTGAQRVTEGYRMGLDFSFSARHLLSDISLAQLRGEAKSVISLGPGRLITRAEMGTTWVERFTETPASLRYFAGGDSSIRGYDYKSLGPRDREGNVIGGKHLLVTSFEYDLPIATNWDLAVFLDAGDAFNHRPNIKRGVGLGVRWHTLVGTIRLDLASPLDAGQSGFRLHFFMGPEL